MTISNLHPNSWEGSCYRIALEVLANPYEVESLIDALLDVLNKHPDLDGGLWVLPLEGVIRIRTGEIDSDAIE